MQRHQTHDPDEPHHFARLRYLLRLLSNVMRRFVDGLPLASNLRRSGDTSFSETQTSLNAFSRYTRAYFQRWLLIGALIGVVAGIGAIVFASAISFCTHLLLGGIAGFFPPQPAGEAGTGVTLPIARRWLIPVITTLGGLITGVIVFRFAPEAEGHGTDAAIESFHEKGGYIRGRIPLVKIVASAITIGSGGSAGREGPTAQISAGFGSWLGDLLHLDDHDRRIAVAAGIGSGIGAIFKAPFGGALLSAEILYKRDFEADALFPSFVASVVGFTVYGIWAGWTPIFGTGGQFHFTQPSSLGGYLILGVSAGLVGLLYPKSLYGIRDLFKRIRVPNYIKPAIGGLLVGLIGLFIPEALGMGYGYVQFGINGDYLHLAAWFMAVLVFVKILTTSLTIGSGGSGGVFGPGMVIGGFLGGALWAALHMIAPELVAGTNPGAFVVVGMGAFFGGIAKAPLAVILMVVEMTGEFSLLPPAMLATMVAYLVTGETSIYENQVPTRLDSPAHRDDYILPLLQRLVVRDATEPWRSTSQIAAAPETPLDQVRQILSDHHLAAIPLINSQGHLTGIVTASALAHVTPKEMPTTNARQIMSRRVPRAFDDEPLYAAWSRMSRKHVRQLIVVSRQSPSRFTGILTLDAVSRLISQHSDTLNSTGGQIAPDGMGGSDGKEIESARVADVMLTTPRTVRESDSLAHARALLDERGAALLVVDAHGLLTGIITRADLRGQSIDEELTVGKIAIRNLITIAPSDTLAAAARKLSRYGLRQLPVVAAKPPTPPIGLLRRSDVLSIYKDEHMSSSVAQRTEVPAEAVVED